jgi:hypothetical protein
LSKYLNNFACKFDITAPKYTGKIKPLENEKKMLQKCQSELAPKMLRSQVIPLQAKRAGR